MQEYLFLAVIIILLVLISLLFTLKKKEKFTFADYDKFPACWCKRNISIV